jgi:hypothetical protein
MTPEIAGRISCCSAAKSKAQYGGHQVEKQSTYLVLPASTRTRLRPCKHWDPPTTSLHQKLLPGSLAAAPLRVKLSMEGSWWSKEFIYPVLRDLTSSRWRPGEYNRSNAPGVL